VFVLLLEEELRTVKGL